MSGGLSDREREELGRLAERLEHPPAGWVPTCPGCGRPAPDLTDAQVDAAGGRAMHPACLEAERREARRPRRIPGRRRRLFAWLGLTLALAAGCSGGSDPEQPGAATTATSGSTAGETLADRDLAVDQTMGELVEALEREGHLGHSRPRKRPVEGGALFGMTHSWELRLSATAQDQPGPLDPKVPTVPAFVNLFGSTDELTDWLETSRGFGGVTVYDEDDVWALSLESDGPARARSVKLARQLDRDLDAWTWGIQAMS